MPGEFAAYRLTAPRTPGKPGVLQSYGKVSRVVKESGLLQRAGWFYLLVGTVLLLALGGATAGFLLLGASWFQLLIAAAIGVIFTQFAFLAHEAAHRAILKSGPANDRIGLVIGNLIIGMSYDWWMSKHTRHHANPNRIGKDPDIDFDTISFVEEDAARQRGLLRFITRRQGYLFFPLLLLEGLNLHFRSVQSLVERRPVKKRWLELGLLATRFAGYLTVLFLFLPVGMAFAFLGVQLAVFGLYMGSTFAPNHKGMPIVGRDEKLDFFTKQVRTSRNISGGWWATILMGGLNYQIEHHLFPSMARPHLAATREIVREHCRTENVPYTETTLLQSYAIVIAYLNRVGLAARDPFDCPVASQYRPR